MSLRPPVLIDGRIFSLQAKGGISQMWAYILSSSVWQRQIDTSLMLYPGHARNIHLAEAGLAAAGSPIHLINSPIPSSDYREFALAEHMALRHAAVTAHRSTLRAVLNTYYGENIYAACPRYVVTALDFAHEELPELIAKPSTPEVLRQKRAAFQDATQVSFISNASRERFFAHYPEFSRTRTGVIYLGHDNKAFDLPKAANTVLHVGTRGVYKNFDTVAKGMHAVMARHPGVRFFVMGGEPADATIEQLQQRFPARVLFDPSPSDEEMNFAMALAGIYVSASRYEGFGIPLLNALRLGTKAVVSDIPVYREIGGRHARFFPATSAAALAAQVELALADVSAPIRPWRTWVDVAEDYVRLILDD
jgi:glycosyltransferase involved in cell wall biosynthesis